jgi:imidazolonepropionase
LKEVISLGTTAIEIKSGYGLDTEQELKMLRVIQRLKQDFPITIKSTFLGAHAIPLEFKNNPDEYVDKIVDEMLPIVAQEKLAEYVDVFCDRGFFTQQQTERILEAAAKYGLKPKIHANELGFTGGVQAGVKYNAVSVDHLEYVGEEEIELLKSSDTMPVVLPGTSFFLNLTYAPARKMVDAGLPLAMASDFNPGSSPSGNMQFIMSLGSLKYKLLPQEAFNAVTINGAYALEISKDEGSITKGKWANLIITRPVPSFEFLTYMFSHDLVETVVVRGKAWTEFAKWF